MHVIVLKYVQVLCITVFFSNNVNCDQLLLQNERKDLQLHYLAACTANCLKNATKSNLELCYYHCSDNTQDSFPKLKLIDENSTVINLVCRDSSSLILNITNNYVARDFIRTKHSAKKSVVLEEDEDADERKDTITNSNTNQTDIRYVYLIKVQESGDDLSARIIYMSNTSIIKIDNLTANTYYNITATIINSNNEYINTSRVEQFRTLTPHYMPGNINEIDIVQFTINRHDRKFVDAYISWKPSKDMTCHYDILCYSPDVADFEIKSIEIRKPEELYKYKLQKLAFDTNFSLAVRGKNTKDMSRESDILWKTIATPSCLDWYRTVDICEPETPQNVTISSTYLSPNSYNLYVSWNMPQYTPNYYEIKMFDLNPLMNDTPNSMFVNVSGNATEVFMPAVSILGYQFEIMVTAFSYGGNATFSNVRSIEGNYFIYEDKWKTLKLSVAIMTPLLGITFSALLLLLIFHRRAKLKRYEERCQYFKDLEQKAPVDPNANYDLKTKHLLTLNSLQMEFDNTYLPDDPMEIKRECIKILDGNIGEGAFGLVRKGLVRFDNGDSKIVAVKMLKDSPRVDDIKEFRREIEVMKSVGSHPNIVGIVGHSIKNLDEMMLLTEYCCNGNLLNYLRLEWQRILEKQRKQNELECLTPPFANNKSPENVFNFDTSFVNEKSLLIYKNIVTANNNQNHMNQSGNNHSNNSNDHIHSIINKSNIENSENVLKSIELATSNNQNNNSNNNCNTRSNANENVNLNDCIVAMENEKNVETNENTSNLIINKLYDEYNELCENQMLCTNACKCKVEIVQNDQNMENEKLTKKCVIKINECNCNRILPKSNDKSIDVSDCNPLSDSDKGSPAGSDATTAPATRLAADHPDDGLYASGSTSAATSAGSGHALAPPADRAPKIVENRCYNNIERAETNYLTTRDLITFAKQVALGMEYLAKNKVIHRDLAARNVLVCADRTIKIADFGLSRDIYQENMYKKTGNGKLPIKWLALESMTHQVYTTQSDVWSYGILLYEIITLGGNPYPSIATSRLLHLLKSGYRMERPRNCSQDIYDLMYSCWKTNPNERPTFTNICEKLDQLLTNMTDNNSLDINVAEDNQSNKTSSNESYLKPI